jgi:hypothetical protein
VPVKAVLATDLALPDRVGEAGKTCHMMPARRRRMVQVEGDGATVYKFAPASEVI